MIFDDDPTSHPSEFWNSNAEIVLEHLTFGRQPRMLFRVWVVQILPFLADVRVFATVHPFARDVFEQPVLREVYLLTTLACLCVLGVFLSRMGNSTFAPRYHRLRSLLASMAGYLCLSGSIVTAAMWLRDLTPGVEGEPFVLDVLLGTAVSSALAALLAIGFYAQFAATNFPRRRRTKQIVGEWIESLDWVDQPDGSRAKDRRYLEFETRTEQVADLLDDAVTVEGRQLRDEFERWRADFERYSLLTRERVVSGDTRNADLEAQHERLRHIVTRLAVIADHPTDERE